MVQPFVPVPLINGNYYSYANIEFRFNGFFIQGVASINYGIKVGSQYIRGTNQMPLGVTMGQVEPRCDVEFYLPQFNFMVGTIPPGFGINSIPANITVTYGNPIDNAGLVTVTDLIVAARIIEIAADNTEGIDGTKRKVTFMPMNVILNGRSIVTTGIPAIGAVG